MTRRFVPILAAVLLSTSGIAAVLYAAAPQQAITVPAPAVQAAGTPMPALPPHPRLLLNKQGIMELKEHIATAPWAKSEWATLKAEADGTLSDSVNLPPRGGNWSHNYVCPTHGSRLKRGKQIGTWEWSIPAPPGRTF